MTAAKCAECGVKVRAGQWSYISPHDHRTRHALIEECGPDPQPVCPDCFRVHGGECSAPTT